MIKVILILLVSTLSFNANAFPELPFCPMGGPPGWMNRFLNHHDYDRPPVFYQPQGYYPQSRAYLPQPFRYEQAPIVPADYNRAYSRNPSLRPSQR